MNDKYNLKFYDDIVPKINLNDFSKSFNDIFDSISKMTSEINGLGKMYSDMITKNFESINKIIKENSCAIQNAYSNIFQSIDSFSKLVANEIQDDTNNLQDVVSDELSEASNHLVEEISSLDFVKDVPEKLPSKKTKWTISDVIALFGVLIAFVSLMLEISSSNQSTYVENVNVYNFNVNSPNDLLDILPKDDINKVDDAIDDYYHIIEE